VNKLPILGCAFAGLVVLAGCGSSKSTTSSSTTAAAAAVTSATTPATTSAPGEAILTKHSKLGTILAAGPKKMTVYLFEGDRPGQAACMEACAQVWPAVTSAGAAQAGGTAVAADLSTLTRPDGTKQVTYKGHPLYFFAKDKDGGDAYGQGIKSFGADWYVLKPNGSKLDTGDSHGSSGNAS
jgi:predicted lipoprotein with Yx(FWY)xxD motif